MVIDASAPKEEVAKRIWRRCATPARPGQLAPCGSASETCWPHESREAERRLDEAPQPRATDALFGHAEAEAALLAAYRSGRVPHAFLLVGPKGIGKATLAYRMARFVLAHPDPAAPEVQAATSLAVDPEHPVARRIAAQAQGDLLILERTLNDKGVLRQQIAVDDVRRTVSFFGSTAGRGRMAHRHRRCGRRAQPLRRQCAAQGAGRAAAARAVAAGQPFRGARAADAALALPRRSRCGRWREADVAAALAAATAEPADDPRDRRGRCRRRRQRRARHGVARRGRIGAAPAGARPARRLPALDRQRAACARRGACRHRSAAARRLRRHRQCLAVAARSTASAGEIGRLARLAEAWERINQAARDAENYNLERKPLVFSVFGLLAEATRG